MVFSWNIFEGTHTVSITHSQLNFLDYNNLKTGFDVFLLILFVFQCILSSWLVILIAIMFIQELLFLLSDFIFYLLFLGCCSCICMQEVEGPSNAAGSSHTRGGSFVNCSSETSSLHWAFDSPACRVSSDLLVGKVLQNWSIHIGWWCFWSRPSARPLSLLLLRVRYILCFCLFWGGKKW